MCFLKKYKDQIASLAAITGTTLSIIALAITAYTLRDTPKMPSLFIQVSESERYGLIAVTYNGGEAPCAEFKIDYPKEVGPLHHIVQYQKSVPPNASIDSSGRVILPLSKLAQIGQCKNDKCSINGTYLEPNQVFAIKLPDNIQSIDLTARCIGDSNLVRTSYET